MKKQIKLIVIIAVVIAVLALALWGISLIPKDSDNVTSGVSQAVKLHEIDKGNVKTVHVKNEWGEYTLVSDGKGGFVEETTKDFKQYTANVSSLVSSLCKVSAKRMIEENSQDLAKYGLDNPKMIATLTDTSDNVYKLSLGNEAPSGGHYFMYNDLATVYTISLVTAENLSLTPLDFVDVMLTDTLEELSFERIELSGSVREKPIVIVNMESQAEEDETVLFTYDIISPGNAHLESNIASEFLTAFSGMYATKAEVLNPTKEDLSKYGFDNPYSVVKLQTTDKTQTVTVGKVEGDLAYVMRDGVDAIFTASKSVLTWIDTQYENLVSNIFLTPYIGDISDVTIKFDDKSYSFKTEYSDETDLTATYKGAEIDPDNFKRFYQVLVSAYLEEYSEETPNGTPSLTLTYTYKDGTTDELKLYKSSEDARKVIIVVNDKPMNFLMRYNFMEKVKADTQNLLDGKEIITDW